MNDFKDGPKTNLALLQIKLYPRFGIEELFKDAMQLGRVDCGFVSLLV